MPNQTLTAGELRQLQQLGFSRPEPSSIPERPFIHKRLCEMARDARMDVPNLWVADNNLPLAVTGNNHLIVSRKLLELLNDREVVAVMSHELGHIMHKHKHAEAGNPAAGIAIGGGVSSAMLVLLMAKLKDQDGPRTRREFLMDLFSSAGVALPVGALAWMGTRHVQASQAIRHEYQADDAAVELSGDKEALISALEKIIKAWGLEKNDANHTRVERLRSR